MLPPDPEPLPLLPPLLPLLLPPSSPPQSTGVLSEDEQPTNAAKASAAGRTHLRGDISNQL